MLASMRTLVVLRHAKSDWPSVPDHDRPLAARGRRDAPAAGAALREAGLVPDRVLVSTALRTRQTWNLVSAELGTDPPAAFDVRIYAADVPSLTQVIREVGDDVGTLLIVGHNPGVQDLTLTFAGSGDPAALEAAAGKFPTGAFSVLTLAGDWPEAGPGTAELTGFCVPRG
jgi:phosphohistidine phosphatase